MKISEEFALMKIYTEFYSEAKALRLLLVVIFSARFPNEE